MGTLSWVAGGTRTCRHSFLLYHVAMAYLLGFCGANSRSRPKRQVRVTSDGSPEPAAEQPESWAKSPPGRAKSLADAAAPLRSSGQPVPSGPEQRRLRPSAHRRSQRCPAAAVPASAVAPAVPQHRHIARSHRPPEQRPSWSRCAPAAAPRTEDHEPPTLWPRLLAQTTLHYQLPLPTAPRLTASDAVPSPAWVLTATPAWCELADCQRATATQLQAQACRPRSTACSKALSRLQPANRWPHVRSPPSSAETAAAHSPVHYQTIYRSAVYGGSWSHPRHFFVRATERSRQLHTQNHPLLRCDLHFFLHARKLRMAKLDFV